MLLYAITDRTQLSSEDALIERIHAAAWAGIDWIQLREKDLAPRELERLAMRARETVTGTAAKLLINSRVDIAIACGLDGVHLTSSPDELPASEARAQFAEAGVASTLIGVSCHTIDDVLGAEAHGADFVVLGPIFGKAEVRGIGVEALRTARAALPSKTTLRMLALGGIDIGNAAACLAAGADGVAGIRQFQQADVRGTVQRLRALATSC